MRLRNADEISKFFCSKISICHDYEKLNEGKSLVKSLRLDVQRENSLLGLTQTIRQIDRAFPSWDG